MHPYIRNLLRDIVAAHQKETEKKLVHSVLESEFEDVEQYLDANGYKQTFGDYCELRPRNFPPAELIIEFIGDVKAAF